MFKKVVFLSFFVTSSIFATESLLEKEKIRIGLNCADTASSSLGDFLFVSGGDKELAAGLRVLGAASDFAQLAFNPDSISGFSEYKEALLISKLLRVGASLSLFSNDSVVKHSGDSLSNMILRSLAGMAFWYGTLKEHQLKNTPNSEAVKNEWMWSNLVGLCARVIADMRIGNSASRGGSLLASLINAYVTIGSVKPELIERLRDDCSVESSHNIDQEELVKRVVECPICGEEFEKDGVIMCGPSGNKHVVACSDCLEGWRDVCEENGERLSCPMCREHIDMDGYGV